MQISLPSFLGSKKPIDLIRTRLTRGLEVRASTDVVTRGEELEATVTVASGKDFGVLEVGLLCTETYEVTDTDNSSGMSWGTVYESWTSVERGAGRQTVRLRVPADGPYTYIGSVLSYRWEVVVRGLRKRRLDARATCDLEVRP